MPNLLQAMVHAGAYLHGAFLGDEIVGAAFGFPAANGGLHLHSHMVAVLPKHRDLGIGASLKSHQYQWALQHNYPFISWTFDPLVKRNAKLNLLKLGVAISEYHPNFYGPMQDPVNSGDDSDRLMAIWKVNQDGPQPREAIARPSTNAILIPIPENIVGMRRKNLDDARRTRIEFRNHFLSAISKGAKVIGFSSNGEYVLEII